MEGSAKINFACCSLSNVFGNGFWTDFGIQLGAILGSNRLSEATSKGRVIKYANEERPKSFDYLPVEKFSPSGLQQEGSGGGSPARSISLQLKLTWVGVSFNLPQESIVTFPLAITGLLG